MLRCKDSWWGKKASRFKEETIGMLVRKKKRKGIDWNADTIEKGEKGGGGGKREEEVKKR